jgi:hypothetical protein
MTKKKVTVIIKDKDRQYQGLRTSLGLLLENHQVSMVVLRHEVALTEEYQDYLAYVDEMGGSRLSDVPRNIEAFGFAPIDLTGLGDLIDHSDLVIPF